MSEVLDKGADATGLVQSLKGLGENPLVREDVLDRLTRRFVGEITDTLSYTGEGRLTRDAGIAAVQASCNYYAGILSGRIVLADFNPVANWNPTGLASFLRDKLSDKIMVTNVDEAVIAESLALIAMLVFKIVDLPEDRHESSIDSIISYAVGLLGGFAE